MGDYVVSRASSFRGRSSAVMAVDLYRGEARTEVADLAHTRSGCRLARKLTHIVAAGWVHAIAGSAGSGGDSIGHVATTRERLTSSGIRRHLNRDAGVVKPGGGSPAASPR
jgi:hypothetical protein